MRTYMVAVKPPLEDFDDGQAAALEAAGLRPITWDRSGSIIGWPNRIRRYVKATAETQDAARSEVGRIAGLEASELQVLEIPS